MKSTVLITLLVSCGTAFGQRNYDTLPNLPEHYVKRYELFKKEPVEKGRIIFVGNSITEGGNWKVLLRDTTVVNRGISGDVTFGVIHRLQEIIDRKPGKVFLLIGINDLSRNTPDEVIVENIFAIAGKIRSGSRKTTLYVQSILPTNETFNNLYKNFVGKGEHVLTINEQLRKYAKKLKYTYVDLYTEFLDGEGRMNAKFTSDGLHLSPAGYSHWVEILKREKYL
ncbi:MAG TPA: GDSL-type esterase/lipase family protein [Cyclobacteriaceae bacterium]|nr:GDSL-type esterase/lipase family protein [Cyclobacteriaceae bacterium]